MSDNSNDQTSTTTTAIVATDGLDAVSEMVRIDELEHRAEIQRNIRDIAELRCHAKIFRQQMIATTDDPDDHRKIMELFKNSKEEAKKMCKGYTTNGSAKVLNDLDDVQPAKKKRKPPSNRGITGMSMHHIHNKHKVNALGFKGKDVLQEQTELWTLLSDDDKAVYDVLAKGYNLFCCEKGNEIAPPSWTETDRKAEIKKVWLALGQGGWDEYTKKAVEGVVLRPIPELAARGSGGSWDERWARRGAADASNDVTNDDALDDDDDAPPPTVSRKKAKKPRPSTASSQAA